MVIDPERERVKRKKKKRAQKKGIRPCQETRNE